MVKSQKEAIACEREEGREVKNTSVGHSCSLTLRRWSPFGKRKNMSSCLLQNQNRLQWGSRFRTISDIK